LKIVVDTSVIVAVIANEPEKTALVELTRGLELIAPPSVHWEVGNAFSAMMKRKRITLNEALKALDVYDKIPIKFLDVELEQTLRIAANLNIYAYDAYIIRCAQKYRTPLVSLDQNLVIQAKNIGIHVKEVN
jgi:predicted nucleic acid-binding protein